MSSNPRKLAMMLLGPLLLLGSFAAYYLLTNQVVSTDYAYIRQDKLSVSPEVSGPIVEILVKENQTVSAGQVLFKIDPKPFQIKVEQAKAQLYRARAHLDVLENDYANSAIDIERAEETVAYFSREHARQVDLLKSNMTSEAEIRATEHALASARADLKKARADSEKARIALSNGGSEDKVNPEIKAAETALAEAEFYLEKTTIRAPISGKVSQTKKLLPGNYVMMGLPSISIVDESNSWVEANIKESDLARVKIGNPVTVRVDAWPEHPLSGQVASIGAGTGSEFSILPAQNASSNWVKVTQRVPLRINLKQSNSLPLVAGLSADIEIDTQP